MKAKILLSITFCFVTIVAMAGSPPATPIDGGLSLLLAAGGAFGVKKYIDHKKNRQS